MGRVIRAKGGLGARLLVVLSDAPFHAAIGRSLVRFSLSIGSTYLSRSYDPPHEFDLYTGEDV